MQVNQAEIKCKHDYVVDRNFKGASYPPKYEGYCARCGKRKKLKEEEYRVLSTKTIGGSKMTNKCKYMDVGGGVKPHLIDKHPVKEVQ